MNSELEYAKSVMTQEAKGVEAFRDALDDQFVKAVDLLCRKPGHIIVSGMGKPGHIGRKISATMASTGSPSFFLHPAEASHGDMGEISKDDVLLILSLSGNTQELIPLLSYANRFGIDIVAITGNPESTLAKSAQAVILMPKIEEACPYNLAPTTTTTMMIAIGDALAMCLLKRTEFNRERFKQLHPGGALGKRLLKVKDLMHEDVPLVNEHDLMKSVLIEMTRKSFGCACVVSENGQIVGIITDGDLRRGISPNFLDMEACEIMSHNPKTVLMEMYAQEATKIMNESKITSLFVTENDYPKGILHIHDCLRAGLV